MFNPDDCTPEERRRMSSRSARGWVLALTSVASLMVALDTLVVSRCSLGAEQR